MFLGLDFISNADQLLVNAKDLTSVDYLFLLDISKSMCDPISASVVASSSSRDRNPQNNPPSKFELAKEFILRNFESMQLSDRCGLVTFSKEAKLETQQYAWIHLHIFY